MTEEKKRTKKKKRQYTRRIVENPAAPLIADAKISEAPPEPTPVTTPPERPQVTKHYTKRTMMLALGVVGVVIGLGAFIIYFFTQNLLLGAPGIIVGIGGGLLFYYYWGKSESLVIEELGGRNKQQVNCLNIYRDWMTFEDWIPEGKKKPEGYPWECLNDHKKYWLNITDLERNTPVAMTMLRPLALPDLQYYDPGVFAERVLGLPARRRLFTRRPKMGQVIKTALLVITIVVLWILIMTTTGG